MCNTLGNGMIKMIQLYNTEKKYIDDFSVDTFLCDQIDKVISEKLI